MACLRQPRRATTQWDEEVEEVEELGDERVSAFRVSVWVLEGRGAGASAVADAQAAGLQQAGTPGHVVGGGGAAWNRYGRPRFAEARAGQGRPGQQAEGMAHGVGAANGQLGSAGDYRGWQHRGRQSTAWTRRWEGGLAVQSELFVTIRRRVIGGRAGGGPGNGARV